MWSGGESGRKGGEREVERPVGVVTDFLYSEQSLSLFALIVNLLFSYSATQPQECNKTQC